MKSAKKKRKVEINIVPLVDVLIVLIFFFIMTMQFRNMNVLKITPPKMDSAGENAVSEQLIIGISKDEESSYFLNNEEVTDDELLQVFAEASEQETKPTILIFADEDTPLKRVTFIMDQCKKYKLDKMRLQSR